MDLLEFSLRDHRLAIPLSHVQRVIHAAAPTPLPGTPACVLGVLNIEGEVTLVIDLARRFGKTAAPLRASQQMVLVQAANRQMAVVADAVHGVTERDIVPASTMPVALAPAGMVNGLLALDDGVSVICNPDEFLLRHECDLVDAAVARLQ